MLASRAQLLRGCEARDRFLARIIEGDLGEAGGTEFPEGNPVPGLSPSMIPPSDAFIRYQCTGSRIQQCGSTEIQYCTGSKTTASMNSRIRGSSFDQIRTRRGPERLFCPVHSADRDIWMRSSQQKGDMENPVRYNSTAVPVDRPPKTGSTVSTHMYRIVQLNRYLHECVRATSYSRL